MKEEERKAFKSKEWEEDLPYSSRIFLWALHMLGGKIAAGVLCLSLSPILPLIQYSFLLSLSTFLVSLFSFRCIRAFFAAPVCK